MAKQLRTLMAKELDASLKKIDSFILFSYDRITSEQAQLLRRSLREKNIRIKVLKNTIAAVAFQNCYNKNMKDMLKGPIAMIYGGESPVDTAKAILECAKKFNKSIFIKGGYLNGQTLSLKDIEELSKTPSKKALLGMVAGMLQNPAAEFASVLTAAIQNVTYAIDGQITKLEKAGT